MSQQESQIIFDHVSYTYQEEETETPVYALKDVSLTVNKGEFLVVLGHNGSGKSTLAKLSNSIYLPSEGKVLVNGMDTSVPENEFPIRKTVGVVFQNPDNQIVASIVEEDVAFGPENLGIPPKEIRRRVDEALKAVDMYDYRLHETHRLSGGQKQRVAIAGMLAMRPECLVLDEPTAMLDPKGRQEVMRIVRRLNREQGMTVVFITHFMEEAVGADRVVIVNDAGIEAVDTPERIFAERDLLSRCGLDVPEIAEIAFLLRSSGIDLPAHILTEEDLVAAVSALASR
jgi:energy-coupling factor transport system ATP-binding protein